MQQTGNCESVVIGILSFTVKEPQRWQTSTLGSWLSGVSVLLTPSPNLESNDHMLSSVLKLTPSEMNHWLTGVSVVWNPSKQLCEQVARVEFSRDAAWHVNGACGFPIHNCRVRGQHMASFFCWCNCIDNLLC